MRECPFLGVIVDPVDAHDDRFGIRGENRAGCTDPMRRRVAIRAQASALRQERNADDVRSVEPVRLSGLDCVELGFVLGEVGLEVPRTRQMDDVILVDPKFIEDLRRDA
jgi:hypothetical protein